ncbi:MAG: glutamate-5-semialdehyde dehydrogenase [Nitrospiria bacterium]
MALYDEIRAAVQGTKAASKVLATRSTHLKNKALLAMADRLESDTAFLIAENQKDFDAGRRKGLSKPLLERLTLTEKRIAAMATGIRDVAALPDPVGEVINMRRRPNGLQVGQMRTPIGVIGIIYESRPNVTADVAALCIKSGNGVVLRGGSEAIHSNTAIASRLQMAVRSSGLPDHLLTLIKTTDRQAIFELLKMDAFIDLIIPRGGEGLIRTVTEHSRIPVMKHDKGICHTFVDASANIEMAEAVCMNAKVQRPSVCNAMETLLVHEAVAPRFLPRIAVLLRKASVDIRACKKTHAILGQDAEGVSPAIADDWHTEYLDLILAVKVVSSLDKAMEHIAVYGSQHSEAIVTQDHSNAMRFLNEVDASAVFINSSTRFNDGYQLGLGAEMGISTSRIHARGPMALVDLTCKKYIILGDGQVLE